MVKSWSAHGDLAGRGGTRHERLAPAARGAYNEGGRRLRRGAQGTARPAVREGPGSRLGGPVPYQAAESTSTTPGKLDGGGMAMPSSRMPSR